MRAYVYIYIYIEKELASFVSSVNSMLLVLLKLLMQNQNSGLQRNENGTVIGRFHAHLTTSYRLKAPPFTMVVACQEKSSLQGERGGICEQLAEVIKGLGSEHYKRSVTPSRKPASVGLTNCQQ